MTVAINIKNLTVMLPVAEQPAPAPPPPRITVVPAVGELWPEQGGINAGMMPAQDGHPAYYLIVPLDTAAEAESLEWGGYGKEVDGLSAWDGAANTKRLVGDGGHPAAQFCAGLGLHGKADWYLPSRREASLAAATVPDQFNAGRYWTSTQYSAYNAVNQNFADGTQRNWDKFDEFRVRAVRRFPI